MGGIKRGGLTGMEERVRELIGFIEKRLEEGRGVLLSEHVTEEEEAAWMQAEHELKEILKKAQELGLKECDANG